MNDGLLEGILRLHAKHRRVNLWLAVPLRGATNFALPPISGRYAQNVVSPDAETGDDQQMGVFTATTADTGDEAPKMTVPDHATLTACAARPKDWRLSNGQRRSD